jgi:hypothetical protein
MNPAERLQEVVTRLTAEQYARLLLFAESLAASHDVHSAKTFPELLRERLRELTCKSEADTLSEAESAEYIVLAEQLEDADAARLEAAAKLSQQDSIPLAEALAKLDAGANGRG